MPSSTGWSPVSRPFAGSSREAAPNDWVQREERYALAMEALDEGVYDWNIELDQIYLSLQLRLMLGMSADEPLNSEQWRSRIHPDDLPRFRATLAGHLKGETQRFRCEYRYRRSDGSWRWARHHGIALRDRRGRARPGSGGAHRARRDRRGRGDRRDRAHRAAGCSATAEPVRVRRRRCRRGSR